LVWKQSAISYQRSALTDGNRFLGFCSFFTGHPHPASAAHLSWCTPICRTRSLRCVPPTTVLAVKATVVCHSRGTADREFSLCHRPDARFLQTPAAPWGEAIQRPPAARQSP